jgi:hypothetical protein
MKARKLTPEILDELDSAHPDSIASRRDLFALNAIMGHRRAWRRWLRAEFNGVGPRVIAELGAGDGAMAAENVVAAFPRGGGELVFVDREPCVSQATLEKLRRSGWAGRVVKADVFDWLAHTSTVDAICANLFLHHFEDSMLVRLFTSLAGATRVFAALEPRRSAIALAGVLALPLMDANRVTLHDARVSVEAGFRGCELSALWPANAWACEERASFPFSHWFCARMQ